jgi:uncharacterized protein (DUF1800 family)
MANLSPIGSWSADDVMHFARRAGFGVRPETATTLAGQSPSTVIDGWVDGTADSTLFNAVMNARADVMWQGADDKDATAAGAVDVAAAAPPHRFLADGADAWRNNFNAAQASWCFRMQHNPNAFQERMALFFHNLFATGASKVDSVALMLNQIQLFRTMSTANFTETLVAVSKDPAMCKWLDSVENSSTYSSTPNENYAREVMELFSLGADNGYTQQDITELARALSGWSYTIAPADWIKDPTYPDNGRPAKGTFVVYQEQTGFTGHRYWWQGLANNGKLYLQHPRNASEANQNKISITFLGQSFDITTTLNSWSPGENALRSITTSRATECSKFLAKRLLTHFVTPNFTDQDRDDVALLIRNNNFNIGATMKALLKSQYFFQNKWALVEGPVSWSVRAARMLSPDLATADSQTPKGFPAWRGLVGNDYDSYIFDNMGQSLLDPTGPNGWKEHVNWINSNTIRYRGRMAAAVALGESIDYYYYNGKNANPQYPKQTVKLFPGEPVDWFPSAPTTAQQVYDRLVLLLQPGPAPASVGTSMINSVFGGVGAAVDVTQSASKNKIRELAYLILCSPAGQVY